MALWCLFALAVGQAAVAGAEPTLQPDSHLDIQLDLKLSSSDAALPDTGEVNVRLTLLDLGALDIEAFGDHDAPPPAR
jgi:hypothetical protein